jgi:hypothetical protein
LVKLMMATMMMIIMINGKYNIYLSSWNFNPFVMPLTYKIKATLKQIQTRELNELETFWNRINPLKFGRRLQLHIVTMMVSCKSIRLLNKSHIAAAQRKGIKFRDQLDCPWKQQWLVKTQVLSCFVHIKLCYVDIIVESEEENVWYLLCDWRDCCKE